MVAVYFPYTDAMTRSSEAPGLRETILTISGELLNEGGPASLSMREVSRRAGCTHQAPYHHFKSREGILAALITEGFLALEKSLSEALRASANASPQETTRAAGHAYLTFALKNPGVFRIMFRSDMYDPNSHPELVQASKAARSQLHGLAKIAYGSEDPRAEATLWRTSTASRSSFSTDRPHLGGTKEKKHTNSHTSASTPPSLSMVFLASEENMRDMSSMSPLMIESIDKNTAVP